MRTMASKRATINRREGRKKPEEKKQVEREISGFGF